MVIILTPPVSPTSSLSSRFRYAHHGIPHRRGYLLYGAPGTLQLLLLLQTFIAVLPAAFLNVQHPHKSLLLSCLPCWE